MFDYIWNTYTSMCSTIAKVLIVFWYLSLVHVQYISSLDQSIVYYVIFIGSETAWEFQCIYWFQGTQTGQVHMSIIITKKKQNNNNNYSNN